MYGLAGKLYYTTESFVHVRVSYVREKVGTGSVWF